MPEQQNVLQQTGNNSQIWTLYETEADLTTIYVRSVDANGRVYIREITVQGNNVLDLGQNQA